MLHFTNHHGDTNKNNMRYPLILQRLPNTRKKRTINAGTDEGKKR